MPEVREIEASETKCACAAFLELRPHHGDVDSLARCIDAQRGGGYRIVGSFEPGEDAAAAVAGFRIGQSLACGQYVYVDDLVTRASRRGRGHADAVMEWVEAEGRRLRCGQLHLDSGVGADRVDAHRFYFRHGMRIEAYHFARGLVS